MRGRGQGLPSARLCPSRARTRALWKGLEPDPPPLHVHRVGLMRAIQQKHDWYRMSFEAIAHLMNQKGIVDGMGGRGWTAKKVRAAYRRFTA